MKTHAKVAKDGSIHLTPLQRSSLSKHAGKFVSCEIDESPTLEKRGYLHGGIIKAIFYQHPFAGWNTFQECYEALIWEFAPFWTKDLKGGRIRSRKSTADGNITNEKLGQLIEKITSWMLENQYQIPDPSEFKEWRDSATDEPYPFMERLKEQYLAAIEKRKSKHPWRK